MVNRFSFRKQETVVAKIFDRDGCEGQVVLAVPFYANEYRVVCSRIHSSRIRAMKFGRKLVEIWSPFLCKIPLEGFAPGGGWLLHIL